MPHDELESSVCRFLAVVLMSLAVFVAVPDICSPSDQYPKSCNDCHGMPPLDSTYRNITTGGFVGSHGTHTEASQKSCARCHIGSDIYLHGHMNYQIDFSDNLNSSPGGGRYYSEGVPISFKNRTSFPSLGTCSNVNCHFENATLVWGSAQFSSTADCSACHAVPGPSAPHVKHDAYFSWSANGCTKCHPDYASGPTFSHATSAASRGIRVTLSEGSYSGTGANWLPSQSASRTLGSCSSVYCHSNGVPFDKAADYKSPAWGVGALGCTGCHDGASDTSALSGRHAKHTGPAGYAYTCDRCHKNTVTGSDTILNRSIHVNTAKDVAFEEGGSYDSGGKGCTATYCHSDGRGGTPQLRSVKWSDTAQVSCYSCHLGRTADSTLANCNAVSGVYSSSKGVCLPDLTMTSNAHHRLVGPQWIRKYPCYYCHNNTVDTSGNVKDKSKHTNGTKDVVMPSQWNIVGRPAPSYNPANKVCDNVYCHSDGTTDPEDIRPIAWTAAKTECNSCHGHPTGSCNNAGCHDNRIDPVTGKVWKLPAKFGNATAYRWASGEEWIGSLPMFPNQGAGTARANSHARHGETNFTCDQCHATTITAGACTACHVNGIPEGGMGEVAHINAAFHVNKNKDVAFKDGGSYNPISKACSGTVCHTSGVDPVWGGSVGSSVTCLSCHGTTNPDVDDYDALNGTRGKINLTEWVVTGHGRYSTAGRYPLSNNPAANFPGNPCWYCHDNSVLHKDAGNPYRLKMHVQYEQRFEKECVYCHMSRINEECIACHVGQTESLSPQATAGGVLFRFSNGSSVTMYPSHTYLNNCITVDCHDSDNGTFSGGGHKGHDADAGIWTLEQKADVKNQYMMMGVCLQCHDDDTGGQCSSCHVAPPENPLKYSLGYDPGTGYIKPKQARASAGHFGYKHYRAFTDSGGWTKDVNGNYLGVWKGGKFCWDCHDPHGDSNIYMVQKKVATTTDGTFGKPLTSSNVIFTSKDSGAGYAKKTAPFDGICNVCHSTNSKHFTNNSGDGHNYSRSCTICHEHRFADSHANKQSCDTCHTSKKPIPKHTAFGLPRDCTKCHSGTVGKRMDVMGQMRSNSHHVQGVEVNNRHCYECHWESTPEGLIDLTYHTGYSYKTYTSVKNDVVDLVLYSPGFRPTVYRDISSAAGKATVTRFLASNMGTAEERNEVSRVSRHCLSCHSDQNNDTDPFGDCKTPRQYAWDYQSIDARYSNAGTTIWGKYPGTANAAKKNITKSFSAHGNGVANQGGFDPANGLDGNIPNTRGGAANVQCFDCHNSHGSKVVGTTTSYATFNGSYNGGNLKETKQNIGGYTNDYKASSNASGVNPYGAGAGQCFDCHNSATSGTVVPTGKTPWGYNSTYGATIPIMGYKDTARFGQGAKASTSRFAERASRATILGGHLKASEPSGSLSNLAKDTGIASSGSTTDVTDSSKNWSANMWQNRYVLMTDGSNSGQIRKITANTATSLTIEPFAAAVAAGDAYKIVPYSAPINGLCTPCHDPHGVSPTLGSDMEYAVPLLKGTWMTSPYKEDAPPPDPYGTEATANSWAKYTYAFKYGLYRAAGNVQPVTKHTLDRNTFGTLDGTANGAPKRFNETDSKFAGLCLNCHKKETLTDGVNKNNGAAGFKSIDRVHESVKGWGANTEHSFTCSKCHQPHNSGLPRLMQTNCLDYKHRGGRASGGVAWGVDKERYGFTRYGYTLGSAGNEHRGFPIGSILGVRDGANITVPEATTACHVARFNPTYNMNPATMTNWPDGNFWNNVTPW